MRKLSNPSHSRIIATGIASLALIALAIGPALAAGGQAPRVSTAAPLSRLALFQGERDADGDEFDEVDNEADEVDEVDETPDTDVDEADDEDDADEAEAPQVTKPKVEKPAPILKIVRTHVESDEDDDDEADDDDDDHDGAEETEHHGGDDGDEHDDD
ncbi:MAG TPA: hypothetical protein VKA85_04320 [Candidatus Limnocylindrales bacterium]|nr:hypothetical protein [Candidatus Limnocylindrales bacterium]